MELTEAQLKEAHKILLQLNVSPRNQQFFEDQRRVLANILAERDEKLAFDIWLLRNVTAQRKVSDEQVRMSLEDPVDRVRPQLANEIMHKLLDEGLIKFEERISSTSLEKIVTATIAVYVAPPA